MNTNDESDEIKHFKLTLKVCGMLLKTMIHYWYIFSLFLSFLQTVNKCSKIITDDWIRTWVLRYGKLSLCLVYCATVLVLECFHSQLTHT